MFKISLYLCTSNTTFCEKKEIVGNRIPIFQFNYMHAIFKRCSVFMLQNICATNVRSIL